MRTVTPSRFMNAFYTESARSRPDPHPDASCKLRGIGRSIEVCKKIEGKPEKTDEVRRNDEERRSNANQYPKRKPRGALFESGDPTLARQLADNPFGSKR